MILPRHHFILLFVLSSIIFSQLDACFERCTKSIRAYNQVMRDIEKQLEIAKAHIIALHLKYPDKNLGVFWDIDDTTLHGKYDHRPILPVLIFYHWCLKQSYIKNIFITSRIEMPNESHNRNRTEDQLKEAGYTNYTALILLPVEVNKRIWREASEKNILNNPELFEKFKITQKGFWKAQKRQDCAEYLELIVALTLDDLLENLGGNPEYLGLAIQIPKIPNIFGCVQECLDLFWRIKNYRRCKSMPSTDSPGPNASPIPHS